MRFLLSLIILFNLPYSISAQDDHSALLDRFNNCDQSLSHREILTLVFYYRNVEDKDKNDQVLEEIEALVEEENYTEVEGICSEILINNPMNHTALYFLVMARLRLDNKDDIMCHWKKNEMVYGAVMNSGNGSEFRPFFVMDVNDAKTLVSQFWKEGTVIDSVTNNSDTAGNNCEVLHITKADGGKDILHFNFDKRKSVDDLFFTYVPDFEFYLAESKKETSLYYYKSLLRRFQANDITLADFEVLALLIGFTSSEHFNPYHHLTTERAIYQLNGEGKFKQALTKCNKLLAEVPLSQQALIEKAYAFHKLGQADSSEIYNWRFGKIMDAMEYSGDGLTTETAIFALGPADGQNYIRKHIRGGIGTMGSGRDKHGNFIDILHMTIEDKETGKSESYPMYFQIEHAIKTMFGGQTIEEPEKKKKKGSKKKKGN